MISILNTLYKDNSKECKKALKRHSVFYNTEPPSGSLVNSIVASFRRKRKVKPNSGGSKSATFIFKISFKRTNLGWNSLTNRIWLRYSK
uniref:PTS system mannose/fructose/sorbose family transporter subunit IID n=1 Tax=Bacillus cytotoxicus TaxID=580165 RepID=UPI00333FC7B7